MEYVIGIDIGATKSHLALFDITGSLIDFGRWGPLNHEVLPGSYAQFGDELKQFVSQILSRNNLKQEQIISAAFGIGGVDTKEQHETISQIIKKNGFNDFTLTNDAFLGIPAGNPDGVGICAINGSGCTLAGINKEGRMLQIGGVGYVSADYGGGGILGQKVVSAVYSELFRKGEPTCMTGALFEKLGLCDKFGFVDKMYEKIREGCLDEHGRAGNFVAGCAKILFEAAKKNDKAALEILYECGISIANGISCMIEELGFNLTNDEINIIFAGSVFVKNDHPLLLDKIREKLNRDNPGCNLKYTLLNMPPVAGAVLLAYKRMRLNEKNIHNNVCKQLENLNFQII